MHVVIVAFENKKKVTRKLVYRIRKNNEKKRHIVFDNDLVQFLSLQINHFETERKWNEDKNEFSKTTFSISSRFKTDFDFF